MEDMTELTNLASPSFSRTRTVLPRRWRAAATLRGSRFWQTGNEEHRSSKLQAQGEAHHFVIEVSDRSCSASVHI